MACFIRPVALKGLLAGLASASKRVTRCILTMVPTTTSALRRARSSDSKCLIRTEQTAVLYLEGLPLCDFENAGLLLVFLTTKFLCLLSVVLPDRISSKTPVGRFRERVSYS